MKKFFYIIILFISCSPKNISPVVQEKPVEAKRDFTAEGFTKATVIDLTGLDGCKFLLQLEDDTKLQPENLDSAFAKKGLSVWVKYFYQKHAISICMAGKVVHINEIYKRE